ncbi:MAG: hypothetical protein EBU46_00660 [Nitrosomonadaceae bacterium]|nr:hypothetical protein [Nitrosomonadaceae bacterium]
MEQLFRRNDPQSLFLARQLMFSRVPLSKLVEMYLYDNEGGPQVLDGFPMMRPIYDKIPRRLLLKCSRKTLKSTLISNMISLNMVRYNFYKMLYIGPNEQFTKYFSSNYLAARFDSPKLKSIIRGLSKNDVFEKTLKDTNSNVILKYASDDATRIRGPATDHNIHDEVQDMDFDILPIVKETMALSKYKREIFAGTPLTTDNTIHQLWKGANQFEWVMKCLGCNHWNSLTIDNEPLKMIQRAGLSCSKCSRLLDSKMGQWADFNAGEHNLVGYHLAQPILPHFNTTDFEWKDIYTKCHSSDYSQLQIYNEVFGLAFDTGTKPITEEQLQSLCSLGEMATVHYRGKHRYQVITMGVDWGVNMETSRTTGCILGLRDDGVCEVFYAKIFKDFDYDLHIRTLAQRAKDYADFAACDSGPDPNRGINFARLYDPQRTQLVQYRQMSFVQQTIVPPNAVDWSQTRWALHRSDSFSFTLNLLKKGKILFPRWEDLGECMQDILNIFIEVKEGPLKAELFYRHAPDAPDDFFHALNYAVCQAYLWAGDPLLQAMSTSSQDAASAAS